MTEHRINQEANDWITCKCGKLFSDSKTISKWTKFRKHLNYEVWDKEKK